MLYTEWKIGDKEPLKLRLRAKDCVQLEKALGTNPLNMLIAVETKDEIPNLTVMVTILHAALQCYHHGFKMDEVLNHYDQYIEAGGSMLELLEVITDVFETSGFLPKDKDGEEEPEKNTAGAI
ncbi:MAG: hypothetical protein HFE75_08680 [Firmicutes bacterium]|jgi:hypothetical protein|nr:hypothetical protein [Bacillota bacterium]